MIRFIQAVFRKLISPEFLKFATVGGISALIEFALFNWLFKLGMDYLVANVVAFAITNIVTYILSRIYVFGASSGNKVMEAVLFFLCLSGALLISQLLLWALVDYADMDELFAKGIAMAIAIVWNFFSRKYIVFKHSNAIPDQSSTDSVVDNF
ncbi:MAG TPA: GtrA family protein [Chryseolinea sp.]|nr:GtrA family protein [Chryseolinea sp.]HPM32022.1 GtrA family protein [Chryseolinea sp.]